MYTNKRKRKTVAILFIACLALFCMAIVINPIDDSSLSASAIEYAHDELNGEFSFIDNSFELDVVEMSSLASSSSPTNSVNLDKNKRGRGCLLQQTGTGVFVKFVDDSSCICNK